MFFEPYSDFSNSDVQVNTIKSDESKLLDNYIPLSDYLLATFHGDPVEGSKSNNLKACEDFKKIVKADNFEKFKCVTDHADLFDCDTFNEDCDSYNDFALLFIARKDESKNNGLGKDAVITIVCVVVGVVIVIVVVILLVYFLVIKKRKQKKEESENEASEV